MDSLGPGTGSRNQIPPGLRSCSWLPAHDCVLALGRDNGGGILLTCAGYGLRPMCPVPLGTKWPARGVPEPCGAPGLPPGAAFSLLWAGPGSLTLDRVGSSSDGLSLSISQDPVPAAPLGLSDNQSQVWDQSSSTVESVNLSISTVEF